MEPRNASTTWSEYSRTGCPRARERLIREYAFLAKRAVERLQITPWGCVSRDDLISHAVIGLVDAIDRFDPSHGTPFEGFAMPRIRGAILDALRQLDWVPRAVRVEETRLRRAYAALETRLRREPTDAEVAAELGITPDDLERLVSDVARGSVLSLEDLVAGMGETTTLGELVPADDSQDPFRHGTREGARRRLAEAVRSLPERERKVVSLYYFYELTLKEIGQTLGVTEQRVSQIHAKAMLRLSHKLIRQRELVTSLAA